MNFKDLKRIIPKLKLSNLNSKTSQIKLAPSFRKEFIKLNSNKLLNSKKAAVIAALYEDDNKVRLILILRNTYNGVHSNQIGFPGGRVEDYDKTLFDTAIRETYEEIGVRVQKNELIRELHEIYIPPSNFNVYPFLVILNHPPSFVKDDKEVKEVITIDLESLLNCKITQTQIPIPAKLNELNIQNDVEVPAFKLAGYNVWGATAMMLSEIRDLINDVI
ncbi:MAG: CoA pyrophosphatase [Flavobacteriaceae bacterium]|jgi:8-oxo-dGTP pyrophosphatase MutT (NUDIX family)|nr:CoA pyrophosphatase [Flavobacteriaceae bacterium]